MWGDVTGRAGRKGAGEVLRDPRENGLRPRALGRHQCFKANDCQGQTWFCEEPLGRAVLPREAKPSEPGYRGKVQSHHSACFPVQGQIGRSADR